MIRIIIISLLFAVSHEAQAEKIEKYPIGVLAHLHQSDDTKAWKSVQSESFLKALAATPADFQDWFVEQSLEFRDLIALRNIADLNWFSKLSERQRNSLADLPSENLNFVLSFELSSRNGFISSINPLFSPRFLEDFLSELDNCIVRGGCAPYSICKKNWDQGIVCKQKTEEIAENMNECMRLFGECEMTGHIRSK